MTEHRNGGRRMAVSFRLTGARGVFIFVFIINQPFDCVIYFVRLANVEQSTAFRSTLGRYIVFIYYVVE